MFGLSKRKINRQPEPVDLLPATRPGDRIYAIGDIHGRYDLLRDLLDAISAHDKSLPPAEETHLIVLGDMIDRGPQSAQVLKFLSTIQQHRDNLVVLLGNHEDLMLRALQKEPGMLKAWMRIGGRETLRSFGLEPPARDEDPIAFMQRVGEVIPSHWVTWLKGLPLMARSGDYLFCHAGIRPGVPLRKQTRADLLWIRDEFLEDPSPLGVIVVHGHSISLEVEDRPNRIGIDTGAYKTGVLTALYLEGTQRAVLSVGSPAAPVEFVLTEREESTPALGRQAG